MISAERTPELTFIFLRMADSFMLRTGGTTASPYSDLIRVKGSLGPLATNRPEARRRATLPSIPRERFCWWLTKSQTTSWSSDAIKRPAGSARPDTWPTCHLLFVLSSLLRFRRHPQSRLDLVSEQERFACSTGSQD